MGNKLGVLAPTVNTAQEYYNTHRTLERDSSGLLVTLSDSSPNADWEKWSLLANAFLVYGEFGMFAGQHNRSLYMTWDELRQELASMKNLDDAIKYLLQKDFLREAYIEV